MINFPITFPGEDERSELDIANRIGGGDSSSESDSDYIRTSSVASSSVVPQLSTDTQTEDVVSDTIPNMKPTDETKRILTFESSSPVPSTDKSALSQVGNIIFQLLGEEGYNSFSCNLTTTDENGNDSGGQYMYRRTNKSFKLNDTLDEIEFEPVDSGSLPDIPQGLRNDPEIRLLLLEFNIFDLCNFTSNDHEINSKKLILCSNGISRVKSHANGKAKLALEKYSQDIAKAVKKSKLIQQSKVKVIKIINLTDYLASTIKDSDIPRDLKSNYVELKQFLLVDLQNEDLSTFHPDSNRKDVFMVQLFDYLIQSKVVDNKRRKLLEVFKKFIRNVN